MENQLSKRLRGVENLFRELDENNIQASMDNEAILALLGEVTSLRHIAQNMERKLARYRDAGRVHDVCQALNFDGGKNNNVILFSAVAKSQPKQFTDTSPEGAA